jgi:hypothetical protein
MEEVYRRLFERRYRMTTALVKPGAASDWTDFSFQITIAP